MDIEQLATSAITDRFARTNRLVPFINNHDKEPTWDGYIAVYETPGDTHRKDDLLARISIQVKGHKAAPHEEEIRYGVELADLDNFQTEGVTVYFVVYIDESGTRKRIYYHAFKQMEIASILSEAAGQQTKTLSFTPFPTDQPEIEALFIGLAGEKTAGLYSSAKARAAGHGVSEMARSPFQYDAELIVFRGREKERERIKAFLDYSDMKNKPFRWWVMAAPGGAGKTRFAYELKKELDESGEWTTRFLCERDYRDLEALPEKYPGKLLLVADYAHQHTKELGRAMTSFFALSDRDRREPLRLLLLARDTGKSGDDLYPRERQILQEGTLDVLLSRHNFEQTGEKKTLTLSPLTDSQLHALIRDFAAARRKQDITLPTLPDGKEAELLEKLAYIDDDRRPLYAMVLTDAYLHDPKAEHWTQEELLRKLVWREREQLKRIIRNLQPTGASLDETLFRLCLRFQCAATALGAEGNLEVQPFVRLCPEDWELLKKKAEQYNIPSPEELLLYLGLLTLDNGTMRIPAIRPDLLGEYAVLDWLRGCTSPVEKTERDCFFQTVLRQQTLFKLFFCRLLTDYSPLIDRDLSLWNLLIPDDLLWKERRLQADTGLYLEFFRCLDKQLSNRLTERQERLVSELERDSAAAAAAHYKLALMYTAKRDYGEASTHHERVREIQAKTFGPDDLELAKSYVDLAQVCMAQNHFAQAMEYHEWALRIREDNLGPEAPATRDSRRLLENARESFIRAQKAEMARAVQKAEAQRTDLTSAGGSTKPDRNGFLAVVRGLFRKTNH